MELNGINAWNAPTLNGFDESNVQEGQRIGGKSNRQYVRFYKKVFTEIYCMEARIDPKSGTSTPLKTGTRDVERLMVHIVTPGDKNEYDGIAYDYHKKNHWPNYKAFMDGKVAPPGTPIDECSYVSQGVALDLKYYNCHTEEQLADASDHLCGIVANGFEIRDFARAKVKAQRENVQPQIQAMKLELTEAQAESAKMIKAMEEMKLQMETMKASIVDSRGNPISSEKKKYGRPKKIITELPQGE